MSLLTKRRFVYCAIGVFSIAALQCVGITAAREGSPASLHANAGSGARPSAGSSARRAPSGELSSVRARRLREGTMISEENGFFREDGDGATFVADSGHEFGALPNLNLERVVRLIKSADEPSSIRWNVAGKVTEFSGRNFLLISRAVYKSAAPPPVPDHIEK